MNFRRRTMLLASLLVGVLFENALPGSAQDLPKVAIAASTFDSSTAGVYALKSGLFKKYGLAVTFVPMSPAAIPSAVIGGTIQIADSNLFNIAEAHARHIPFTIVAPSAMFDDTDLNGYVGLIVRKDSPIETGRDLDGKNVGVPALKDFNTLATMLWIDKNGGDSSTVHFIEVPASASAQAVVARRIDATVLTAPFLTQAVDSGAVRVLTPVYDSISKSYLGLGWVATTSYAAAHPDVIRRFGLAMRDAAIYCNSHQAETVDMMAALAKSDPAALRKATRVKFSPYITAAMVQPVIDVLARYKVIGQTFDAKELISPYALRPPDR